MALRTKILGIQKKSFTHTREALHWAEKTFTGDHENAAELTRFRLMVRDIKRNEGATTTITVIFDAHGAIIIWKCLVASPGAPVPNAGNRSRRGRQQQITTSFF